MQDDRMMSEAANNVPVAMQALIEARVNTAMDQARESLRREVREERDENRKRSWLFYGGSGIATVVFAVVAWRCGYGEVRELTEKYVTENMNKPTLEAAAKDVVTNRMGGFVSEEMKPVVDRIDALRGLVEKAEGGMDRLNVEERALSDKLGVLMDKTHAFELLPDGRVVIGATVLGNPWKYAEGGSNLTQTALSSRWEEAYSLATNLIWCEEATEVRIKGLNGMGDVYPNPLSRASVFAVGSFSALKCKRQAEAVALAKKAFDISGTANNRALVVVVLRAAGQNDEAQKWTSQGIEKGGEEAAEFVKALELFGIHRVVPK